MKKVVVSIIVVFLSFVSFSQKTMNFLTQENSYYRTDVDNFESFEDSIYETDSLGEFFIIYNIDLDKDIVETSVDDGDVMRLYHVLSKTKSKNKIDLVLSTNNEISFLSIRKKGKMVKEVSHHSIFNDLIIGVKSKNIDNLN